MPDRARIALILAVACAALLAPAAVPAGATYVSAKPRLTVEPPVVAPGSSIVVKGRGFRHRARVTLYIGPPRSEGDRVGSAKTNRRGRFSKTLGLSAGAPDGRFVVLACQRACRVKATKSFTISSTGPIG